MGNIKKSYREFLISAIETLANCEDDLFTNAINILMAGELNDINEVFDIGDEYEFEFNHLDTSNDLNVRKIVEVIKTLRSAIESLKNLNSVTDDELQDE